MLSKATTRKYRRRQLLVREGEVCQHKIFVSKGLLRTYRLQEDGTEIIMRFAAENSWNVDHESFYHQTPTKYIPGDLPAGAAAYGGVVSWGVEGDAEPDQACAGEG